MDSILYPDDVVAKKANESLLAVVERTHGDVDTHEPRPGRTEPEPVGHDSDIKTSVFKKFMKDGVPPEGTVLVRWQHTPNAQLIPESKLKLVDRSLLIGDVVKRSVQDPMSGIVLNTFTKCTLQPMCDLTFKNNSLHLKGLLPTTGATIDIRQPASGKPAPLFAVPTSELKCVDSPTEEDLVIFKDWIGRVEGVSSKIILRLSDNCVVEIDEELAEHADGTLDAFYVGDIASTKKGVLRNGRWIFGQYNANTPAIGTVVDVRKEAVDVTWLQRRIGSSEHEREPPAALERDELESSDFCVYDRTRRASLRIMTETISNSEMEVRLGLRVKFKDLSGACVKYDGSTKHGRLQQIPRKDTLGYDLNVFDIISFQTDVTVQWQDLSITTLATTEVVPDASIDDEHAAWPGEIAHTVDQAPVPGMAGVTQPSKVGVVQDVNASERMARIQWCQDSCLQYSEDELDNPGFKSLLTGVVGTPTGEQEVASLYDIETPGEINVRRGDIVLIANQRWKEASLVGPASELDWLGEIVDTRLDGTLTVRLGAAPEVPDVNLRREDVRVAVRSDGTDDVDQWDDDQFPAMAVDSDGEMTLAGDGSGESDMADMGGSDWDSDDGDEEIDESEPEATYEDEDGHPLDEEDVENEEWESDIDEGADIEMADGPRDTPPTSQSATPPKTPDVITAETLASAPEQYLILESPVTASHPFASERSTDTAAHMKRVQKEHKILRSANALPSRVYVRTWESRLDLIRVLFVGSAATPYADAPFVVDFYLPSSFPTDPPRAHFHSWPAGNGLGGVGRVNPNLYEDGKICLSLLGTWEGNKGEGWNASRSTLLQVVVSILGLVLVREPYFNEAGYEPLAGLESARRPSALYNERTYLQSRTFIYSALARLGTSPATSGPGVEGLENVVGWLYAAPSGPHLLEKAIADAEMVLSRSEQVTAEPDGLAVMSKGACIPLRRIINKLKEI